MEIDRIRFLEENIHHCLVEDFKDLMIDDRNCSFYSLVKKIKLYSEPATITGEELKVLIIRAVVYLMKFYLVEASHLDCDGRLIPIKSKTIDEIIDDVSIFLDKNTDHDLLYDPDRLDQLKLYFKMVLPRI